MPRICIIAPDGLDGWAILSSCGQSSGKPWVAMLAGDLHDVVAHADSHQLIEHMIKDKKTTNGQLNFVLVRGIGDAFVKKNVAYDDVTAVLDATTIDEVLT